MHAHLLASISIKREVSLAMCCGHLDQLDFWAHFACLITTHASAVQIVETLTQCTATQLKQITLDVMRGPLAFCLGYPDLLTPDALAS